MRFAAKIGLLLVAVGVLPVALLGLVSYFVSRGELQRTVGRMQAQAAEDLALFTDRFASSTVESLRLAVSYLPIDDLARSELAAVLAIPYRQLPAVSILAVVDEGGVPIAGPVFERDPASAPGPSARERVGDADLERFARRIPAVDDATGATAIGDPYRVPGGPPRLAVALRLGPNRILAAEISLREVEDRLKDLSLKSNVAYLVDGAGAIIAHGRSDEPPPTADERSLWEAGFRDRTNGARLLERHDGQRWLAAFANVPRLGWGAVVAQPMAVAFSAAERLRFYTFAWSCVSLVVAFVMGALLARTVTKPVERLSRAAANIAAGDYGQPVEASGGAELAGLARAFNRMAAELRRRDEEIRGWNRELQKRVEERTAELKSAQDQILRTRRMAALGSLGAGLAHELNNPMTAITGYLSILRKRFPEGAPEAEMVSRALEQAQRVTRVVEDLRSFADQEKGPGQRFSLVRPVRAALELYGERLRAAGIQLDLRCEEGLPDAQGDPVQIQQVVAHLVENAVNAMPNGGRLEVSVGTVDGDALRLRVADTGKGIPADLKERIFDPFFTTKDQPARVGLGLSVSHSIVEAHHGRIVVESEPGIGAAVTVLLPAAAARAHLV